MEVRQEHLWAFVLIVAVIASFGLQRYQNNKAATEAKENNVASCIREVTRDAYEAAGFIQLAVRVEQRNDEGDKEAGARYRGVAFSVAATFPQADTLDHPTEMIQVNTEQAPNGSIRFRLTEDASELIQNGCRQVF